MFIYLFCEVSPREVLPESNSIKVAINILSLLKRCLYEDQQMFKIFSWKLFSHNFLINYQTLHEEFDCYDFKKCKHFLTCSSLFRLYYITHQTFYLKGQIWRFSNWCGPHNWKFCTAENFKEIFTFSDNFLC